MSNGLALRRRAPKDLVPRQLIPDLAVHQQTPEPPIHFETEQWRKDHRKQWREDCERADVTYYEGPLND